MSDGRGLTRKEMLGIMKWVQVVGWNFDGISDDLNLFLN
jgi:hypothetical protein